MCGAKSSVAEKFSDLSLPLPSIVRKGKGISGDVSGIELCLDDFMKAEEISDRQCDECKARCDAKKKYSIKNSPPVLVVHIKRFAHTGRGFKKLNTFVSYPEELNIEPYIYDAGDGGEKAEKAEGFDYSLNGVVVHGGTLNGGHYSAFVRRAKTDIGNNSNDHDWVYMSDSRVRIATKEEALERKGAYILFYTRKGYSSEQIDSILQPRNGTIVEMQQNAIKEQMVKQHGADTLGTPPPPPPPIEQTESGKQRVDTEERICDRNEASSPPAPSSSYHSIKPLSEVRVENQRNAAGSISTMSSSLPVELHYQIWMSVAKT